MNISKHEQQAFRVLIREELSADIEAITEVTVAAFKTLPISNHTEQYIINALRNADALTISLVAELEGRVVGHIAFSPMTISDGTTGWYGLGPISVLPKYQRQGIGKSLVKKGIALLKEKGGQGCALVGDPEYYKRFDFMNSQDMELTGVPQEVFLVLPFTQSHPKGVVEFHKGFLAEAW